MKGGSMKDDERLLIDVACKIHVSWDAAMELAKHQKAKGDEGLSGEAMAHAAAGDAESIERLRQFVQAGIRTTDVIKARCDLRINEAATLIHKAREALAEFGDGEAEKGGD